ncbi:MAG: fructosamine kinase family protein [Bacteroidetes bacterium]|nr:fructosamine kinase family protein [Bacteroidota bacterium]
MVPTEVTTVITKFLNSKILNFKSVSGGSINTAIKIETKERNYFLKLNNTAKYPQMFELEARGLNLLRETNEIKIPNTIHIGNTENFSFLLLEWLESSIQSKNFWEIFGISLAKLHQNTNVNFGLDHDNYIGSLKQYNTGKLDWASFFIENRIEFQLRLARNNQFVDKAITSKFDSLFSIMDNIFPKEKPSLLHGDLWSGNFMADNNGNPCIFDPAAYFGHREMDIAMTKLFGGFNQEFYNSYNGEFKLENGWEERIDICNLYPLLVHLNLFGQGYLTDILRILKRF